MAVCLCKDPPCYQFSLTSGICGNDDLPDILPVKLGFHRIILLGGLAYHHQFHFLRHHGKRGKLPFGIFFIVFFRICQCYQMSQGPGHYIVFSFQGSVPLLTAVEDSGNVSGNGWLLRNY